jgi:uncharacterized membrane protein SpoIIM required for sporulation
MKQSVFIRMNKAKWQEYEDKLKSERTPAEEIAKMYIHLTEDLAFAKGKFPRADFTGYLNKLALQAHNLIYRNKPERKNRIVTFWKEEVPLLMGTSGKPMLYSFLMLLVGIILGALSAANDETFVRLILSDQYVDMTIRNIESGNPMGVYGNMDPISMFFMITANNIKVSFIAFIAGIATSFMVGFVLFRNGVMLGAFHYLFYQYGLFDSTILTIWLHGTIEITSIVIAGGAGLILGNGLLFPGTYPRLDSITSAAKKGLKIVIGLIPYFILAGFIESFITRYGNMHLALKLLIILGSTSLLIYYFVLLPRKLQKNE